MVWKVNKRHCSVFVLVYGNLCTFTVSEHIVFLERAETINAIEYFYTQNKGFVHLHALFNIGFL